MRQCPNCGAMLSGTTSGIWICPNCGASATTTERKVSGNTVPLPYIIPKESLETYIKDLTTRVSALEAELESLKRHISKETIVLSAEGHEKAKEDLLRALEVSNSVPIIELPKSIWYVYIIRERTDEGWDIVGNICYLTFEDAYEKMKQLIKDYLQLDPDYDTNNLNIIRVKVSE